MKKNIKSDTIYNYKVQYLYLKHIYIKDIFEILDYEIELLKEDIECQDFSNIQNILYIIKSISKDFRFLDINNLIYLDFYCYREYLDIEEMEEELKKLNISAI